MKVRCKLGKKRPVAKPQEPLPKPPSRIARQLALAYKIERMIEAGDLRDYAEAARRLGVSRARVSQIFGLLHLAPAVQEGIVAGVLRNCERGLRRVVAEADWPAQVALEPRLVGR